MSSLNEKLNKLREQTEDENSLDRIKDWEKQANEASVITHLLQFDGMKIFFATLEGKINAINRELMENPNLDETSRITMFARKDCYREVIKMFTDKQKLLENMEKNINEELKD